MKILFAMNLPYEPTFGGANKANRKVAELLAARFHTVRVIAPSIQHGHSVGGSCSTAAAQEGLDNDRSELNSVTINGVDLRTVNGSTAQLRDHFAWQLRSYCPDCLVISSEDPMQLLLAEAIRYAPERVIYVAHTPNCLPFGPHSFRKTRNGAWLFKQLGAVVAVSRFCAEYIRTWAEVEPWQIYLPVYGEGPFLNYGKFESGYITLINPCLYKGIDIFIGLARMFPATPFAGVASWGTTEIDRQRMAACPNVTILDPDPNIDIILKQTRILLVPSLYLENFPMIIIEAMLRGIPIVASNVGGIPEAKMGTNYVVPIQPIEVYTDQWDEKKLWIPVVPKQDLTPWGSALTALLSNQAIYERESNLGMKVARDFAIALNLDRLEWIINCIGTGATTCLRSSPDRTDRA